MKKILVKFCPKFLDLNASIYTVLRGPDKRFQRAGFGSRALPCLCKGLPTFDWFKTKVKVSLPSNDLGMKNSVKVPPFHIWRKLLFCKAQVIVIVTKSSHLWRHLRATPMIRMIKLLLFIFNYFLLFVIKLHLLDFNSFFLHTFLQF